MKNDADLQKVICCVSYHEIKKIKSSFTVLA